MATIKLRINSQDHLIDIDPSTPLLWVIRDTVGLTGTKYGCGKGFCGACTVHLEGRAFRSCLVPVSAVEGREIRTIEGFARDRDNPVVRAWIENKVPQCGYCQAGQIMQAADLLAENPDPSDGEIDRAMSGNLCRCGTYQRIRRAIHRGAELMGKK